VAECLSEEKGTRDEGVGTKNVPECLSEEKAASLKPQAARQLEGTRDEGVGTKK